MSDTPRTDAEECEMFIGVSVFSPVDMQQTFDFARQLERELNRACEMYRKLDIHTLNLVDRIRRLEEAGDRLADPFHVGEDDIKRWNKAKEDKL